MVSLLFFFYFSSNNVTLYNLFVFCVSIGGSFSLIADLDDIFLLRLDCKFVYL